MRIVRRRAIPRTATISLAVAIGAALLMFVVWRLWQTEEVVRPYQRTLAEMELHWRCKSGHTFNASGHSFDADGLTKPRACWTCNKSAFPVARYTCPVHGTHEVGVRFAVAEAGNPVVSQVLWPGQDWVPATVGLRCPRCDRPLVYQREDPLADLRRARRRGGG